MFNPQTPRISHPRPLQTRSRRTPSPTNPNYVQMFKVAVPLPEDRLYSCALNIRAVDRRFGGLGKPVLGTTTIALSNYLPWRSAGNRARLTRELADFTGDWRDIELAQIEALEAGGGGASSSPEPDGDARAWMEALAASGAVPAAPTVGVHEARSLQRPGEWEYERNDRKKWLEGREVLTRELELAIPKARAPL